MKSVDYSFWGNYIGEIHSTLGKPTDLALEIASGNCILSKYLKNQFQELYLSDLSVEMLRQNKTDQHTVCCDMLHLPFQIEFDFIFSAFDSINYLETEKKLEYFFNNLSNNLTTEGYFVFDVSLRGNSLKHVKNLNRKGKYKGIEYNQMSFFDDSENIHTNTLEIKLKNGNVFKEVHKQKIYDFYYYFEVLESADLYVSECFEAFTFDEGTPNSERVQFIVKRKN